MLTKIGDTLEREIPCTIAVCLMGAFPRPKKCRVGNKFVDLALVLARRGLSIAWKSPEGPDKVRWEKEVQKWAEAEQQALRKEEAKGLRRRPMASDWATIISNFVEDEEHERA